MKKLFTIALLLALAGCDKDPVKRQGTDNVQVQVDDLFTHNGCTISRFYDGGRAHYFADCRGSVSTARSEYCGKNCRRTVHDELQTLK